MKLSAFEPHFEFPFITLKRHTLSHQIQSSVLVLYTNTQRRRKLAFHGHRSIEQLRIRITSYTRNGYNNFTNYCYQMWSITLMLIC